MKRLIPTLLLPLLGTSLLAGGFQVNLQGTRQLGMAHCGAGLAFDASSIFFNPGGLAFAEDGVGDRRFSAVASVNAVKALVGYSELAPGNYRAGNASELPTPFSLYFAGRLMKNLHGGVGVYTPFGSTIRYEDDWKGQFLLRELSLRTIFVQPTISYRINKWGIGLGGVYALGSVSLRRGVPVQFADASYGEVTLQGKGGGWGWNAGIHYQHSAAWSFGANFRSGLKFNADGGTASFVVPNDLTQYFPSTTFSSSIHLPWNATLGAAWKMPSPAGDSKWLIAADATLIGWSVYDTLSFDFTDNTDKLADSHSPREYHNSVIVRLGAERIMGNGNLRLRGGLYFDGTPVDPGYMTPETPDANKIGISAGASWNITEQFSLDAAFLWVEGARRESTNLETNFSGSWKGRAFVPSFGLNYNLSAGE